MAEITTTQAFSDGDTVTATKLNNITANAALQTEAITNRSAETTVDQANDLLLMYDASATALKKISLSNVIKAGTASNFPVTGNATIGGTLGVTGASTLSSTLGVSDTISATKGSGTGLAVTSNATIGGTLGVSGASTLANTAVLGTLGVSDTISATKSTGTGLAVTNNATIGGTLAVTGAITASSTVNGTTIPTSKTLVTTDDTQTLTGKTVNLASNTLAGTLAQFNTSCSDADFASLGGSETLTNKTLTSPVISGGTINNAVIGGTTAAAGSFTTLSATSPITTQAGTAASPAIVPTGDTNTGIFFPAADTIAFSEGGTESMRIDSSGNVGIGVTPSAWGSSFVGLQVGGASSIWTDKTNGLRTFINTNTYFDGTNRKYLGNGAASEYLQGTDGSHAWYSAGSGTAGSNITMSPRLTIDSSGNVGIGTTSPSTKLDVQGGRTFLSANNEQYGLGVRYINTGGPVYFGALSNSATPDAVISNAGGSALATFTNAGNVGIGTTSPSHKLHINSGGNQPVLFESTAIVSVSYFKDSGTTATPYCGSSGNNFYIGTNSTERLRIGSAGQIGIGGANYGTSGQVLTSNGSGSAPSWQANTPADGTITYAKLSTSATEADNVSKRVAKAWVDFNQLSSASLSGTYSQAGTTVTVTATSHGLSAGEIIYFDATTGTGTDQQASVVSVTSANVFTFTSTASATTSGNCTLTRHTITSSFNVSSVADRANGISIVNFTSDFADTNYVAISDVSNTDANYNVGGNANSAPNCNCSHHAVSSIRLNVFNGGSATMMDIGRTKLVIFAS